MKNSIKILALATLLSTSAFASGKKPVMVNKPVADSLRFVPLADNSGIKLHIIHCAKMAVEVLIYDGNHNLVMSESLPRETETVRRYLLNETGTYYFIVNSGRTRTEKKVTVASQNSTMVTINN